MNNWKCRYVLFGVISGLGDRYYTLAYADTPLSIVAVAAVARVKSWLRSFVTECNEKMGTPYRKCIGAISDAVDRCK